MKKVAMGLVLGVAGLGAQAAIVGWQFKGLTEHGFNDPAVEVVPFKLYIEIDTTAIARGPEWDGPGTAVGAGQFWWSLGGNTPFGDCYGGGPTTLARFYASETGFSMAAIYPNNDCAVVVHFGGMATGLEVLNDPLTYRYDTTNFSASVEMSGFTYFPSLSVTYASQMIPEPSAAALLGTGLAGLALMRNRRRTSSKGSQA
jgi:hypothetical protein